MQIVDTNQSLQIRELSCAESDLIVTVTRDDYKICKLYVLLQERRLHMQKVCKSIDFLQAPEGFAISQRLSASRWRRGSNTDWLFAALKGHIVNYSVQQITTHLPQHRSCNCMLQICKKYPSRQRSYTLAPLI